MPLRPARNVNDFEFVFPIPSIDTSFPENKPSIYLEFMPENCFGSASKRCLRKYLLELSRTGNVLNLRRPCVAERPRRCRQPSHDPFPILSVPIPLFRQPYTGTTTIVDFVAVHLQTIEGEFGARLSDALPEGVVGLYYRYPFTCRRRPVENFVARC